MAGFPATLPASGLPRPPLPVVGRLSEVAELRPPSNAKDGIFHLHRSWPSATDMLPPLAAPEPAVREGAPYSPRPHTRSAPAPAVNAAPWPAPTAASYTWRERRRGRPGPCGSRQD